MEIHPVGYSSSRGWPLEPPSDLKPLRSGAIASLLEEHKAIDCEASLLSPAQQMKTGMLVEVEDLRQPRTVWLAKVARNVGGRLLLKYVLPKIAESKEENREENDEWLFCLSPRLHWRGWAASQSGPSWTYSPPVQVRHLCAEDNCWSSVSSELLTVADKPWPFQQDISAHHSNVGDVVQALDPWNPVCLRAATVVEVVDSHRLLVRLDPLQSDQVATDQEETEVTELKCVCFSTSVFRSVKTEADASQASETDESGFVEGMALEVANPWKRSDIYVGVVTSTLQSGALLRIRFERTEQSDGGNPAEFLAPASSQDLFPIGWCDDNGWPLTSPPVVTDPSTPQLEVHEPEHILSHQVDENVNTAESTGAIPTATSTMTAASSASTALPISTGISYWCPKIYFNFRCFSGPLLSRVRVAALPRSVGPGPISLMMKEVLSLLLNGAYKPGSVLKQLQGEPGDPLPPGTQLEPLKAKYRQTTYRGTVPMASTAADVANYCRWVCDKLQCCPYLFAPELVGDPCPHRCCILAKTVWQHKKKAPNWRHRRFVDILKSLPSGLDPATVVDLQHNNSSNKSGPASLAAIESAEHSDEEDSDTATAADTSQQGHQQQNPVADPDEPVAKRRRGRPRKNPIQTVTNGDDDGRHVDPSPANGCEKHCNQYQYPPPRPLDLSGKPPPDRWRPMDVWRFIQSTECHPLADRLLQYEVDGPSLLLLQPADIMDYITLNWELAFRLCHLIGCLRLTYSPRADGINLNKM